MFASSKSKVAKRVGVGATALGAGAAALVLAAGPASAAVNAVAVNPGIALGSQPFGAGCSYEVTASLSSNDPVYFTDNNNLIVPGSVPVTGGVAKVTWTPTTPGDHTIRAYQYLNYPPYYSENSQLVRVGQGINLGSACLAF